MPDRDVNDEQDGGKLVSHLVDALRAIQAKHLITFSIGPLHRQCPIRGIPVFV